MHTAHHVHRAIGGTALACALALTAACGGDDDDSRAAASNGPAPTAAANGTTKPDASGERGCSFLEAGTVGEKFALEVTTVESPIAGHCFFGTSPEPDKPNVGVTVLRNELGDPLYDEFASEIRDVGTGSGGSGVVEPDIGDAAIAAPGPDAVDLAVRRGNVNVRVTAVVPSGSPLSQDEILAGATELASLAL
jgi:hypothetical protein